MNMQTRWFPFTVWIIVLIALWELISWMLLHVWEVPLAQAKLPYLHEVILTMGKYAATLLQEGWATFSNAAFGFLVGAVIGWLLAIWMSLSKWMENLAFPYAVASQMVPILGLAPIIYGIFRDQELARILIAGYIAFFPVALNTLRGIKSVSSNSQELMHVYAANPLQVYWMLKIPASLPGFFSGLKIAAPLAVTGAILVELMGAQNGIGVIMLSNLYYGSSHTYMFWSTVITGALMGLFSYGLITLIERRTTPWQPEFHHKGGEKK